MRKIILPSLLLFVLYTTFSSCNKDTQVTKTITDTVTVTPTPSILSLLTGKQWIFDTLYSNYTGPGTGTVQYARGASGNIQDLDNAVGFSWPDGTDLYIDNNGNYVPGTWSIDDIDSTNLIESSYGGTSRGKILKLDATHFNFFDSTHNLLNIQVYKP
jgi:hypothetical protein